MATHADDWSDQDFVPPPDRTIDELITSLHQRMNGGVLDGAMIEDLRLYVVARMLQGMNQNEVENELIGWGLPSDYVVDLVCSTRSAGNYRPVEIERETFINGISAGVNRSPTYGARVRDMERAESRVRQAERMLGIDGTPKPNPNLDFDTTDVPTAGNVHTLEPRWAKFFHRLMFATFVVGVAALLYVVLVCSGVV